MFNYSRPHCRDVRYLFLVSVWPRIGFDDFADSRTDWHFLKTYIFNALAIVGPELI